MNMKNAILALTLAGGLMLISVPSRAQMVRPTPPAQGLTLGGVAILSSANAVLKTYGKPTALVSQGENKSPVQKRPAGVLLLVPNDLPDWAKSVAPQLNAGHVLWLYKRSDYVLAFRVDILNLVNAILVTGTNVSDMAVTQLVTLKGRFTLGDDVGKVVRGVGYPDTVQLFGQGEIDAARGYVLTYELDEGLSFTVRNKRVVHIVLWESPKQEKLRYLNHDALSSGSG